MWIANRQDRDRLSRLVIKTYYYNYNLVIGNLNSSYSGNIFLFFYRNISFYNFTLPTLKWNLVAPAIKIYFSRFKFASSKKNIPFSASSIACFGNKLSFRNRNIASDSENVSVKTRKIYSLRRNIAFLKRNIACLSRIIAINNREYCLSEKQFSLFNKQHFYPR